MSQINNELGEESALTFDQMSELTDKQQAVDMYSIKHYVLSIKNGTNSTIVYPQGPREKV